MIEFTPKGIIHSPFRKPDGMPVQPAGAAGVKGSVQIFDEKKIKTIKGRKSDNRFG